VLSIRQRAAKIVLFSVVFGFIGFAACVPAHRSVPVYTLQPVCQRGKVLDNGRCTCPRGAVEENGTCVCNGIVDTKDSRCVPDKPQGTAPY
jgi:hypothetical protein